MHGDGLSCLAISAFVLQYIVATLVLFMAIHLILASTTPIATIGKLWVVYIVLDRPWSARARASRTRRGGWSAEAWQDSS